MKRRRSILLPEIIIVLGLLVTLGFLGSKLFEKNQSYSILKESLEDEIKLLNEQYVQDSIMYTEIKLRNDSLQGILKKARLDITTMQARYDGIAIRFKITTDSLERLPDTLLLATITNQTEYVSDKRDTLLLIPSPIIRAAILKIAENKMFRFQIDTLLQINNSYKKYTLGLEKLIIGKDNQIKAGERKLVTRNIAYDKLNLVNIAQSEEIKKYKRKQTLIIGGATLVVTTITVALIVSAF